MIEDVVAHVEQAVFASPLFKALMNRCTTAATSDWSDATTGVTIRATVTAASIARIVRLLVSTLSSTAWRNSLGIAMSAMRSIDGK